MRQPSPKTVEKLAFSLVELSIVLVILGLLVGGVLAGQSLIRAAELRAAGTEFTRYQTAIYSFRDKYFALPGDMTNAASFWSTTTNGNGDGIYASTTEGLMAWQQLAFASMVEGSYSGTAGTTATFIGASVPRSKLSGGGHQIWSESKAAEGWSGGDAANTVQFFRLGALYSGADPPVRIGNAILKPEEAWNLDTKLDDGKPGLGKFFIYASAGGCADTSVTTTATYQLNTTSVVCLPHFIF